MRVILALAPAVIVLTVAGSADAKVRLVSVTSPVHPGEKATLVAHVSPAAKCSIVVHYKTGPSTVHDLSPKKSASGRVSWSWRVGRNATPGRWPITVSCGVAGILSTSLVVKYQTNRLRGASLATCTPSPCTTGTDQADTTLTYPDSDPVNGNTPKTVHNNFWINRPNNLSGQAPLLIIFGSSGDSDTLAFKTMAAANRFIIAYIPGTHLCGSHSGCQYGGPATNPDPLTIGAHTCGSRGTAPCDDAPWVKAVIQAMECSGAFPCENIDPKRVYVVGGSKGGTEADDVICDTTTSSLISAAVAVSTYFISPNTSNPSGVQTAAPYCPAILGTSNGYGGSAGLPANPNLSVMWIYGAYDSLVGCLGPNYNCLDVGQVDGKKRWNFSTPQNVGDAHPLPPATVAGSNVLIGHRLGCSGTPSINITYGTTNHLNKKIYTGCTNPNVAVAAMRVNAPPSGHSWNNLNTVDSFNSQQAAWDFLAAYGGK